MTSNNELITFDDGKVDLIKRTVAKGATHDELALFLHQAQRMGLDPLARQIHFQKFISNSGEANVAFITTIDGYRLIADRTGRYAGNDEPVFEGRGSGEYRGTYTFPQKATVTVWKIVGGSRVAFSASAYWAEYYPGDSNRGHMWRKMPHVMLAKVAEAAALRKAFPADLSGAYTREEMDQAGDVVEGIVYEPEPPQTPEIQPVAAVEAEVSTNGHAAQETAVDGENATLEPGRIADLRATIDGSGETVKIGFVLDRLVMAGLYSHVNHALNAAKQWDGWPDGYTVKIGNVIKTANGLRLYDWLVERKAEASA